MLEWKCTDPNTHCRRQRRVSIRIQRTHTHVHYIAHCRRRKRKQKYYLRTKTNCSAINQWNSKYTERNIETFFSLSLRFWIITTTNRLFFLCSSWRQFKQSSWQLNVNSFFQSLVISLYVLSLSLSPILLLSSFPLFSFCLLSISFCLSSFFWIDVSQRQHVNSGINSVNFGISRLDINEINISC